MHPACRHFPLCSWPHPQMANPELGARSVPAPAAGQLLSTQRQIRRGRECAFPFPLLACLSKSFQLLLISSLPLLGTQKWQIPKGRGGGQESPEEAAGWLVLSSPPCGWGHPSKASAPCCSRYPCKTRSVASAWLSQGTVLSPFAGCDLCLVEGFLLSAWVRLLWGSEWEEGCVYVVVIAGGLQLLGSQGGECLMPG